MHLNRIALASIATLMLLAPAAQALQAGKTAQQRDYVSGGISREELDQLAQMKARYTLHLLTAAKGSGAHLAGVKVSIVDDRGQPVLATEMDGPWLYVDLAPGRYRIEANFEGQVERRQTQIAPTGRRQLIIYFASDAEVSPDLIDERAGAKPEVPAGR